MEGEKFKTIIGRKKFITTENPLETLVTENLDSCVALALVEDLGKEPVNEYLPRRRGLGHIYTCGKVIYDKKEKLMVLSEEDRKNTEEFMKEFLNKFKDSYAFIIANRFVLTKEDYENPLSDYVVQFLKEKDIPIKFLDKNKYLWVGEKQKNKREIVYKNINLHHKRMYITYIDSGNTVLNHPFGGPIRSEGPIPEYSGIPLE